MKMKKIILGLVFTLLLLEAENIVDKVKYEELGNYVPQTYSSKDKEGNIKYVSYYPKGGIHTDMPVVLFIKGAGPAGIYGYRGIMKFLASKGYYVMGVNTASYESWYVAKHLDLALDEIIKKHKLNVSKLAVIGHSLGGGQIFYVMKKFRKKGYGHKGNLALSIDGWFSFDMNEKDLSSLNINTSFLQMNGVHGTGTDPRIHLKIWSLLTASEKSFYTLDTNNHSYVGGSLSNILNKKDLLFIIGALSDDAFNNTKKGQKVIAQKNKASYTDVFKALQAESTYRSGDCKGIQYNAIKIIKKNDIDYCSLPSSLN
jgi:hypothetical protein